MTVTNLEAILITWLSPEWRADVISVLVILKERRQAQAGTSPAPPADEPDSEN